MQNTIGRFRNDTDFNGSAKIGGHSGTLHGNDYIDGEAANDIVWMIAA